MLLAAGDFQVVWIGFLPFTQHDVDGARNGPCARFGGGCPQNFNPFHLLGGERVHRKSRRHALAIEQDLGIATAQTPHANRTSSAGCALHRHTGQALEHIAQGRIALFVDLFTADHDLGGGGLAPRLAVVVAVAANLNLPQVCGCRCWRRCLCRHDTAGRHQQCGGCRAP